MQSKYWCFTLNNYDENEEETLKVLYNTPSTGISYLVYGKEVGETGTRHLQGYIEFSQRKRLTQLKRLLGDRYHLEKRCGTAHQADEYCRKDGDFVTYGEISVLQQGQRNDLLALHECLKENKSLQYLTDEHFGHFLRYQRGISAARSVYAIQRLWQCSVIVYWGKTGTGKTRTVFENLASFDDIYIHPGGSWFDGYDSQPIVLFDDYGGSEFKLTYFLKLLDRYPMRVPIKGGFVSWVPQEIYITSNRDPKAWYQGASQDHVEAMFRRFTNVVYFEDS